MDAIFISVEGKLLFAFYFETFKGQWMQSLFLLKENYYLLSILKLSKANGCNLYFC
jgi:hypothetical protein